MSKLHVMTILGTRPEIIRLSRTIHKLDQFFEHTIVHTGQNYDFELNEIFFQQLKIRKPDIFLEAVGKSAAITISNIIAKVDDVLEKVKPDAVLVLGDTNSCLSVIAAKRRKIPIFHIEAGNRCYDLRVPEEINRRIVDHTSDVNLTYSDIARECLLNEGMSPDMVIKVGSPMKEVLDFYSALIEESSVMSILGLEAKRYYLVSLHREENVDSINNLTKFVNFLNDLSKEMNTKVVISLHPRTRQRIESSTLALSKNIILHRPFGFIDYIKLQMNAKTVLSDSGTISEESSILGFPALNLREVQERHEAFEEGGVMLVGSDYELAMQALKILECESVANYEMKKVVKDYNVDNFSEKVVKIILSYIGYVNRRTWRKLD